MYNFIKNNREKLIIFLSISPFINIIFGAITFLIYVLINMLHIGAASYIAASIFNFKFILSDYLVYKYVLSTGYKTFFNHFILAVCADYFLIVLIIGIFINCYNPALWLISFTNIYFFTLIIELINYIFIKTDNKPYIKYTVFIIFYIFYILSTNYFSLCLRAIEYKPIIPNSFFNIPGYFIALLSVNIVPLYFVIRTNIVQKYGYKIILIYLSVCISEYFIITYYYLK